MRSRTIRPGFFDDFALGRLPHGARLLFIGLWCVADREGRILDLPRRIAAEVYPHDGEGIEADVAIWIAELEMAGVITRYQIDGQKCIHVNNFARFQKCHPNEAESRLPPPPDFGITKGAPKVYQRFTNGEPLVSPKVNQCQTKGEPLVSPKVDQCQRTSTSTSTSTSINPPTPLAGGHTPPTDSDTRINALADTYPTTAGRQQGIRAICEIVSESANPETALAGMEAHWPAWCEFLGERDAQYRPRLDRFVRSNDWMHPPPEPTRKGKTAEQPAKPDCLWDLNDGVDAAALGLTSDEFAARLAEELGGKPS